MIFMGDIASPTEETTDSLRRTLSESGSVFNGKRLVCNFEGLINEETGSGRNEPVLFNHPTVPEVFDRGLPPVLCLANNHVTDLPGQFGNTVSLLARSGIPWCGAGYTKIDAEQPVIFDEGPVRIALFNACWDFLLYNHKNPSSGVFVSVIDEPRLLESVAALNKTDPELKIVVYLHWNLDLETLPFPMHRQFVRALIDAGAGLVVGSHSHCVQGGERYRDGYIVYGLGNFFMPHDVFISGRLTYPGFASTELAFEWDPSSGEATCHWFRYDHSGKGHILVHTGSEKFEESEKLTAFSPFRGMNDDEYTAFYKRNRRKKMLIPVYRDYRARRLNSLYTTFLKSRARLARMLARLRIIKWQN